MIKYILTNKQWIFSGIGVLGLTLLIAAGKYYWVRTNSELNAASEPEEVPVRTLKWHSQEQRIPVGDFHSFVSGFNSIRVQVLEITRVPVSGAFGSPEEEEEVAHLQIDLLGVLTNGSAVKEVRDNSYLVPALDRGRSLSLAGPPETERCLFDFSTRGDFSFVAVCVTHINPKSQSVDVNVQGVKSQ